MSVANKVTWMTHYPGLQTNHVYMCGANLSTMANEQKQSQLVPIPSSSYSCEYRISAPTLTYRKTAKLLLWIEFTNLVSVYIYSGTDRTNLTTLIEGNNTSGIGAPYSVEIDDGIVIVAHALYQAASGSTLASSNGTFQFGYKIEG
jgi:hypothetical protein